MSVNLPRKFANYDLPKLLRSVANGEEAQERKTGVIFEMAAERIEKVIATIQDYHYAFDTRQHGGVAAGKAMDAIQEAFGMPWTQGEEVRRRMKLQPK